mmetsp:Transcript_127813/g.255266  ORF Transcript_127813/g.255266 Transcript_127813/m.255266 type:complete len:127 (-) Transcript_127813:1131-1511(-)
MLAALSSVFVFVLFHYAWTIAAALAGGRIQPAKPRTVAFCNAEFGTLRVQKGPFRWRGKTKGALQDPGPIKSGKRCLDKYHGATAIQLTTVHRVLEKFPLIIRRHVEVNEQSSGFLLYHLSDLMVV